LQGICETIPALTGQRYVYDFDEPSDGGRKLLGGKGIGLAEMTQLGVPVPAGFTITTDACRAYMAGGGLPEGLEEEVDRHLSVLEEKKTGKRFGDPGDPLLVSVRSGAAISMPGMMDTILNVGLNDTSVQGLAGTDRQRGVRIRLLPLVDRDVRRDPVPTASASERFNPVGESPARGVRAAERRSRPHRGDFPHGPARAAAPGRSLPSSSRGSRPPQGVPKHVRDPARPRTAVNIVQMVFGNKGDGSGTGVAFTRNPSTGEQRPVRRVPRERAGEDVVAGIRTPQPIGEMPNGTRRHSSSCSRR
jgi:pyruvate,orthophosphate dikinase